MLTKEIALTGYFQTIGVTIDKRLPRDRVETHDPQVSLRQTSLTEYEYYFITKPGDLEDNTGMATYYILRFFQENPNQPFKKDILLEEGFTYSQIDHSLRKLTEYIIRRPDLYNLSCANYYWKNIDHDITSNMLQEALPPI